MLIYVQDMKMKQICSFTPTPIPETREMSKVSKFTPNFLCVYCICIYLGTLYECIITPESVVAW